MNTKTKADNAPAVVNKYRYYSGKKESAYGKLPGHTRRAIEREANLQVSGYEMSETYGEWTRDENNAQELLAAHCEYYASRPQDHQHLSDRESAEMRIYSTDSSRNDHRNRIIKSIARDIDDSIRFHKEHNPNSNRNEAQRSPKNIIAQTKQKTL